jgi:hypothetical protein
MDEIGLKPFRPYNIIMTSQFGKKAGGNISTCEVLIQGFSSVILSEGSL